MLVGYLLAIASAAAGGVYFCLGAFLVKPAVGVSVIAFTRTVYVWATLFGFLGALLSGHRRALRLTGPQIAANALLGVLFAVSVILAFDSVVVIQATTSAVLQRTNVLFVLLLGFLLLGDRLTRSELAAAFLVVCGVALMLKGQSDLLGRGPMEALGSALASALYQLTAKKTLAQVPAPVVNAYRNVSVLVIFVAYELIGGRSSAPPEGRIYWTIVVAAFVGPFLHTLLNLMALARLEVSKAALVAQMQPIFVLLYSSLIVWLLPSQAAAWKFSGPR
ncbi:MAG: DMT family transporter [Candidatus Riflebacteria bacterium]|nr:DMT family transporter [Candidatus Riflebacteria bacterium]